MTSRIRALPKAELHVHMQGAASVETVLALSRRSPQIGLPQDETAMREFLRFRDFPSFISVYVAVAELVRTGDDIVELALGLARDLAASNVRYAEATVTTDSHLRAGIAPDELCEALNRGRTAALATYGVELGWVFDIDGGFGLPSAERTLDWCERFMPDGSVGFGIGGPEAGVPRSAFADVFTRARELGLHSVPHAGETVGPEEIRASLDFLGAERIGHGISASTDPELMRELVDRGITLEICPTSNVCTGAVASIDEHPYPVLRDAGVLLTINSDDPGMFGTDLVNEYEIAHSVFGADWDELTNLARQSVRSSFAPDETKSRLLAEIDEVSVVAQ